MNAIFEFQRKRLIKAINDETERCGWHFHWICQINFTMHRRQSWPSVWMIYCTIRTKTLHGKRKKAHKHECTHVKFRKQKNNSHEETFNHKRVHTFCIEMKWNLLGAIFVHFLLIISVSQLCWHSENWKFMFDSAANEVIKIAPFTCPMAHSSWLCYDINTK